MKQLDLELTHTIDYRQKLFHIAPCNELAYQWVISWPEKFHTIQCSCVYGPSSSGKTHLANIWQLRLNAFFIQTSHIQTYLPRDLIALNDFFICDMLNFARDEVWFFNFYNLVIEKRKYWLILSETAPKQWPIVLKDLKSRLLTSHTIPLNMPDDDTCGIILKKLLQDRGLFVKDRMILYIIRRIPRSYPSLFFWAKIFSNWYNQVGRLSFEDLAHLLETHETNLLAQV